MKNTIIFIIISIFASECFAKNITVKLFEDIDITLPIETSIKGSPHLISKLPNNSLQGLLSFKKGVILNLPDGVVLTIDISDNATTSAQMNGVSMLNWLTVVSAYTKMVHKQVKIKQERGYKTVSTLTGHNIGNYRAIVSRIGWITEKGISNLFVEDVFQEKAMLSIKVTWVSDQSDSETIADQVISSLSIANLK